MEIEISKIHPFKNHPFKVLDDEKMQETVESVREHGVLMPGMNSWLLPIPKLNGSDSFLEIPKTHILAK